MEVTVGIMGVGEAGWSNAGGKGKRYRKGNGVERKKKKRKKEEQKKENKSEDTDRGDNTLGMVALIVTTRRNIR